MRATIIPPVTGQLYEGLPTQRTEGERFERRFRAVERDGERLGGRREPRQPLSMATHRHRLSDDCHIPKSTHRAGSPMTPDLKAVNE